MDELSSDDYLALNAACVRDNDTVVENLVKKGISVNKYNHFKSKDKSHSCTPLHVAVWHQSMKVLKILLQNGANIEAKNEIGQTPLHLAFYKRKTLYPSKNSLDIIDILLSNIKKTHTNVVDSTGLSHFHIACTRDQLDVINHFLLCEVDVNSQVHLDSLNFAGFTPLHFAILSRQRSVINILLFHGADTTIKNKDQETPFHFAFHHFYTDDELINLVLSKYTPKHINPFNSFGISHFHIACTTNNVEAIHAFIENKIEINTSVNINSPKCAGYTALHFAVDFNRKKIVQLLLDNGADINAKDKEGFTPLHMACQQSAKKIFYILKNSRSSNTNFSNDHGLACFFKSDEAVSNKELTEEYESRNFEKVFKEAPAKFLISVAKQSEQMEIVDLLLQYKSHVNSQDCSGKTPLFYACEFDHETFTFTFGKQMTQSLHFIMNEFYNRRSRIITALLNHNCEINVFDNEGKTVLHYIADRDKPFNDEKKTELAEILLDHGADVNAKTKMNLTPLHIALKKGLSDLAEVFIRYNIDPNIVERENHQTSLHLATHNDLLAPKSEVIIRALLNKGADPDLKDIEGKTPLHLAASTRYSTNRLPPLLEVECDIDAMDVKGRTALHMACLNRNVDNVKVLLNNGADINVTDHKGKTAFYYFCQFQIEILVSQSLIYDFHQIYHLFKNHIRRLKVLNFPISYQNISDFIELKDLHRQQVNNPEVDDILLQCENEVKKMKEIKLTNYTNLYDILFKDPNQMALYTKNHVILNILNSNSFKNDFPQYGFLIQLQFNKGSSRDKLLEPAKNSLAKLIGISLPDLCSETIFRYLNNKSLKNIIESIQL